jgi:transcriptional regulator with XRE-family HTH domain
MKKKSKTSTEVHPLRVLRLSLGKTQKDMGDMVFTSRRTIRDIELGKISLPPSVAQLIQTATGVDAEWLMRGQMEKPLPVHPKDIKRRRRIAFDLPESLAGRPRRAQTRCSPLAIQAGELEKPALRPKLAERLQRVKLAEGQSEVKSSAPVPMPSINTLAEYFAGLMNTLLAAYEHGTLVEWSLVGKRHLYQLHQRFGSDKQLDQLVPPIVPGQNPHDQPNLERLVKRFAQEAVRMEEAFRKQLSAHRQKLLKPPKPRNFLPREPIRETALEYAADNPTLPALTVARIMFKKNPYLFWDVEHALSSIRHYRKIMGHLQKPIFIPRGSSEKGQLVCGLLAQFPNASNSCLGRIAHRDFPEFFPTVDHGRTLVAYHRRKQSTAKKPS